MKYSKKTISWAFLLAAICGVLFVANAFLGVMVQIVGCLLYLGHMMDARRKKRMAEAGFECICIGVAFLVGASVASLFMD